MEPYMHQEQLIEFKKMNENLEKIAKELKTSNDLKKKELESHFRGK